MLVELFRHVSTLARRRLLLAEHDCDPEGSAADHACNICDNPCHC